MNDEREYYTLTRKAFDFLAPFYNIMTLPLVRVRDRVAAIAGAGKISTVLDVATGTGEQAFAFAKQGHEVTGIDLTESMLRVAAKRNRNSLVKFEVGDGTHLRFKENTFDISCISFALHDMPPSIREKVLREMTRVTKPDGAVIIVDYDLPHNKIGRALVYGLVSLYEVGYYKQFIRSDLDSLLQKTGIEITKKVSVLYSAGRILKGRKTAVRQVG